MAKLHIGVLLVCVLSSQFSAILCCPQSIKSAANSVKNTADKVVVFFRGAKPKYIGCYKDDERNRDVQFIGARKPDMTIRKCNKICKENHPMTKYFGVQNGDICFCGNDYGNYGVAPDGHCDKPCAGAKKEICGSAVGNSVYEITVET